jgi:arabinose-5-phosphate isomerase
MIVNKDLIEAHRVLAIEAKAIAQLQKRLGDEFARAIELLVAIRGKVIVTGMGKSGQIGRKIASTMSSTGTPAIFLHPAESSHGDLGVVSEQDAVLAISYGGETQEISDIIRYCSRKGIPLIAMSGVVKSTLGKAANVCLDISVEEEACPLGLAPTSSSTVTLVLGDCLAMALLKRRGFQEADFAEFHPGGSLGRKLLTRVADVMHSGSDLPLVKVDTVMREVVGIMTGRQVRGVAGVVDENENLIGVITDGDIRRRFEKSLNPLEDRAGDLMSKAPKTVDSSELAEKAAFMMEQFDIQTLFVIARGSAAPKRPVGILHLQDLLKAKLR